jgi:hypothetical protein
MVTPLPPPVSPALPVVPLVLLDVPPPQDTNPAANTTVNVMSRKPRVTAPLNLWRRLVASIIRHIRHNSAKAMLHAIDLPNAGRLCAEGAEMNIPLVGVPWRVKM